MPVTIGACEVKPAYMFGNSPLPQVEEGGAGGGFRKKGRCKKTVMKKA